MEMGSRWHHILRVGLGLDTSANTTESHVQVVSNTCEKSALGISQKHQERGRESQRLGHHKTMRSLKEMLDPSSSLARDRKLTMYHCLLSKDRSILYSVPRYLGIVYCWHILQQPALNKISLLHLLNCFLGRPIITTLWRGVTFSCRTYNQLFPFQLQLQSLLHQCPRCGIFSSSASELAILYLIPPSLATGPEAPSSPGIPSSGSGPYPATFYTDASLPNHTIYAPISPPHDLKLPFISWSNGICQTNGTSCEFFLTDLASWGYVIAAEGLPNGFNNTPSIFSTVAMSREAIDWATNQSSDFKRKYGKIDREKVATAGHSCGGLEALSTAYHDERVKRILLFDISIFEDDKRYLLKAINVPVSWFEGGLLDFTYPLAVKDYALLNIGLPAFKASLDTGHYGTFFATNGGKFAKAAVAYLEWQFRKDERDRRVCLDADPAGSLVSQNWTVEFKNWEEW